jgi:hypothetical protein
VRGAAAAFALIRVIGGIGVIHVQVHLSQGDATAVL